MKMSGPAKISVSLPIEIKHILAILVFASSMIELHDLVIGGAAEDQAVTLIWEAVGLAAFYSLAGAVFGRFSGRRVSVLAVSVPAMLLAVFLKAEAALPVYLAWLFIELCEDMFWPELLLYIACDILMAYKWFNGSLVLGEAFTCKIVITALVILSVSTIRRKSPFIFFLGLFLFMLIIPVRDEPINWNPVINAASRVVEKTKDMTRSLNYYLSDIGFGSSYHTGYSSLDQTGAALISSDKQELEIRTRDNTTFRYVDDKTGQKIIRRKTIYLTGNGRVDKDKLLDFLFTMYTHGADPSEAALFSTTGRMEITYEYLKTRDEIFPDCLMSLEDADGDEVYGSSLKHKKGYRLQACYMDIDYGSPYLEEMIAHPVTVIKKSDTGYKTMAAYVLATYGIRLNKYVSEEEYVSWQERSTPGPEYLETDGATDRMRELAHEVTAGCSNDLSRCRVIEAFLRQYKYSRDTGAAGKGSTADAAGMSDITDRFLFESGEGYCVHFASSMVMLLRMNGIPARLSGGYRYTFPFDRREVYEVSSGDAHIWPEAYIEGFGWMGFEPTAAFSTSSDRTWHRKAESGDGRHSADEPAAGPVNMGHTDVPMPYNESEASDNDPGMEGRGAFLEYVKITLIVILMILITLVLMIILAMVIRAVRYKMSDRDKRLKMDIRDIIMYIKKASGRTFNDRGLMSDYEPYVPDEYMGRAAEAFDIYYRLLYRDPDSDQGKNEVSEEEGNRVRELRNSMYEYSKKAGRYKKA